MYVLNNHKERQFPVISVIPGGRTGIRNPLILNEFSIGESPAVMLYEISYKSSGVATANGAGTYFSRISLIVCTTPVPTARTKYTPVATG